MSSNLASINRLRALRQVGGFDEAIKGAGEDMDLESRIKGAGWLLRKTSAIFYEVCRPSWSALWKRYYWHGFGAYHLIRKNVRVNYAYGSSLSSIVLEQIARSGKAYRITNRKQVFFLPLHWFFKKSAWLLGLWRGFASHSRS